MIPSAASGERRPAAAIAGIDRCASLVAALTDSPGRPSKRRRAAAAAAPRLLAGGNPQIAKGDGDASVQAYLEAMPGWKQDVGRRVDAIVVANVPDVRKAVRWNTPFYGVPGRGWFLAMHCFAKYVKLTFLAGVDLRPEPPIAGKDPRARSVHVGEGPAWDVDGLAEWVRQASRLAGWDGF